MRAREENHRRIEKQISVCGSAGPAGHAIATTARRRAAAETSDRAARPAYASAGDVAIPFAFDHAGPDVLAHDLGTATDTNATRAGAATRIVAIGAADHAARVGAMALHGAAGAAIVRTLVRAETLKTAVVVANGAAARHVVATLRAAVAITIDVASVAARALTALTSAAQAGVAARNGKQQKARHRADDQVLEAGANSAPIIRK